MDKSSQPLPWWRILWKRWMAVGHFMSNIVTGIFLVIFYYTIFGLFAIPFRLFAHPLNAKSSNSNWIEKSKARQDLDAFANEY